MVFKAKSISFLFASPNGRIIGFFVLATLSIRGIWLISGDAILYAGQFIFSKKLTALISNGLEKISIPIDLEYLKILEVNFKGINVLEDQNLREGVKVFSDWPTIPQLYIKKEFVGGCDIIKEMYENGELKKVFDDKGINYKK